MRFRSDCQNDAEAALNARQILLFGGIEALYGSSVKLTASEGIYILNGNEKALGASAPIRLTAGRMEADAPNIFVDHEIQIGQNIFDQNFPGFLHIGQNSQSGIKQITYSSTKKLVQNATANYVSTPQIQ